MNKRGIDDPESEAYEDDARALERELAAVVRRALVEELEKPEFRRKLESTVAKEIRSQVGAQKRALREEGEAPRRTFESGGRAGQEEDLYGGERGPKPVDMASRRRDGYSRHRREEGFAWPRTFREWTPWLLGACLLLVVVWGVWFAVEKFRPQGSEAAPAEEALSDRGDPLDQTSARTDDSTSTDPGGAPRKHGRAWLPRCSTRSGCARTARRRRRSPKALRFWARRPRSSSIASSRRRRAEPSTGAPGGSTAIFPRTSTAA